MPKHTFDVSPEQFGRNHDRSTMPKHTFDVSPEQFRDLMRQASAVLAFALDHPPEPEPGEHRDLYERVAEHVAVRNGYHANSTVTDDLWIALRTERAPRGEPTAHLNAPDVGGA